MKFQIEEMIIKRINGSKMKRGKQQVSTEYLLIGS